MGHLLVPRAASARRSHRGALFDERAASVSASQSADGQRCAGQTAGGVGWGCIYSYIMTLSPAAVSDGDFIMESLSRMVNGRRFAPTLLGALKFTDVDRKQGRIGAQITINEAVR